MGFYARLYPQVVERLKTSPKFHGSWCRDLFIEHAAGRWAVDNQAERLIVELVEEGLVKILERAPTHSQAAFAGLQYNAKSYAQQPWGPGLVEHHRYEWQP
jgi:hypothetical protein